MNQSLVWNNYNVDVSLNERTIYVKLINKLNFVMYDSNVEPKEINLPFELADIYKIIIKCFLCEQSFEVSSIIDASIMKLQFHAVVGGFLKTKFGFHLREKIMCADGQLTIYVNKLEQKCETLEEKCNSLETKLKQQLDFFGSMIYTIYNMTAPNHAPVIVEYPINTKEISIDLQSFPHFEWHRGQQNKMLNKLNIFYNLENLNLYSFDGNILDTLPILNSVKYFMIYSPHYVMNSIEGIMKMPNLETLAFNGDRIQIEPSNLILILNQMKLKKLIVANCNPLKDNGQLKVYCKENNIEFI